MKQSETNPFPFSDSNKRYYTYDYYMKNKHGGKCAKIPLDAGFTCPNIDGKCGSGGCIYCSGRGSGDSAESPALSITEQYNIMRERLSKKWSTDRCIAYFQAHTNTYAPLSVLKEKFEEAISLPGVCELGIATRADCLPNEVISYIDSLTDRISVTVELGLQSTFDETAAVINRGHTYTEFCDGYFRLRNGAPRADVCIHLIFGLPGEDKSMMLENVRRVAELHPRQVKLHLLHVIKGTALAKLYESGSYTPMERQDYIDTVCEALTLLPEDTVIGRLTGDGMADSLLAPMWSLKKVSVINDIDKKMYSDGIFQGKMLKKCIKK